MLKGPSIWHLDWVMQYFALNETANCKLFTDFCLFDIEWENPQSFYDFVASNNFKAFGAKLKPFALSPPALQIYETNTSPLEAFSSPVTAVTRIRVENDQKLEDVRTSWGCLIDALRSKFGNVVSLSGPSLNLEEKMFLGVIGWKTLEVSPPTQARQNPKAADELGTRKCNDDSRSGRGEGGIG